MESSMEVDAQSEEWNITSYPGGLRYEYRQYEINNVFGVPHLGAPHPTQTKSTFLMLNPMRTQQCCYLRALIG